MACVINLNTSFYMIISVIVIVIDNICFVNSIGKFYLVGFMSAGFG